MVEIEIISGFLGAGKTTFLNQYLPLLSGKTVVIENECGEVGIDKKLLPKEIPVKEISGGCICCSLTLDLQEGIKEVVSRFDPDHIIIEPSGLGRLSDIVCACEKLHDMGMNEIVIAKKITIVDAKSYDEFIDGFGVFYSDQIQFADIILMSRVEELDKNTVERIVLDLSERNKKASIYCGDLRRIEGKDLQKILNMTVVQRKEEKDSGGEECKISWYGNFFQTITIYRPRKITAEELVKVLEQLRDEKKGYVLRAKGRIETPEHSFLQFDFTLSDYSYQNVGPGRCSVIVIGLHMNKREIEKMFQEPISAGVAEIIKFKREGGRKK